MENRCKKTNNWKDWFRLVLPVCSTDKMIVIYTSKV